jgi:hypothetical protein
MIKFCCSLAPNPKKVALFLEEMGLPHELVPVDAQKDEQRELAFLAINPNAKLPAIIVGHSSLFGSGRALQERGVGTKGLRGQPLRIRSHAPLGYCEHATGQAEVHGWRQLFHCRHGGLGLVQVLGPDGVKGLPNVQRHQGEFGARPTASMDEAARLAMFPHSGKRVA